MKLVTIIPDGDDTTKEWLSVVRRADRFFRRRHVVVEVKNPLLAEGKAYLQQLRRKLSYGFYDVLCVAAQPGKGFLAFSEEEQVRLLEKAREHSSKIVLMEAGGGDSPAAPHLLPYTDLYLRCVLPEANPEDFGVSWRFDDVKGLIRELDDDAEKERFANAFMESLGVGPYEK